MEDCTNWPNQYTARTIRVLLGTVIFLLLSVWLCAFFILRSMMIVGFLEPVAYTCTFWRTRKFFDLFELFIFCWMKLVIVYWMAIVLPTQRYNTALGRLSRFYATEIPPLDKNCIYLPHERGEKIDSIITKNEEKKTNYCFTETKF